MQWGFVILVGLNKKVEDFFFPSTHVLRVYDLRPRV